METYVLEIPDLGYVINQDTVSQWQVFLRQSSNRYQKLHWQLSLSANALLLQNISLKEGPLESVHIDLKAHQIIFRKGRMEDREFQKFLHSLLDAFFIRVRPDQMHFVISPNYLLPGDFGISE